MGVGLVSAEAQLGLFDKPAPPAPPRMTFAEALEHKWFGQACPACGAEPGHPCKRVDPDDPYRTLHGMRTR